MADPRGTSARVGPPQSPSHQASLIPFRAIRRDCRMDRAAGSEDLPTWFRDPHIDYPLLVLGERDPFGPASSPQPDRRQRRNRIDAMIRTGSARQSRTLASEAASRPMRSIPSWLKPTLPAGRSTCMRHRSTSMAAPTESSTER